MLPLLFSLGFSVLGEAEPVYKVVDKDGNITYTDQPPGVSKLEPFKLPPINPVSSPAPKPDLNAPLESSADSAAQADSDGEAIRYSQAVILSPRDQQLILHDQLSIIIQLGLDPQIRAGHLVQFWLNGKPLGRPVEATAYQLDNIKRGAHRIGATVLDAQGRSLISAAPVQIHVKRHFKRSVAPTQPNST